MRVLPFPSKSSRIPDGYTVIGSAVSGGSFEAYLDSMMQHYNGKVCMHLAPVARKFTLPCYDGQGEEISAAEIEKIGSSGKFSEILCCNRFFLRSPATVILCDDVNSLKKKYQIAASKNIPFLLATEDILQKI